MADLVAEVVERLRTAGVRLDPGLREPEIRSVEERFGFEFCGVHRALLSAALPYGSAAYPDRQWPDWRAGSAADLRGRLDWPVDGVVFNVLHNGFWSASWGERPPRPDDAERVAREHLASVPRMVPIYGHRYLPAEPAPADPPVLSIHQTDVIYYDDNLVDYVAHEFHVPPFNPTGTEEARRVRFWSDLADGAAAPEL